MQLPERRFLGDQRRSESWRSRLRNRAGASRMGHRSWPARGLAGATC